MIWIESTYIPTPTARTEVFLRGNWYNLPKRETCGLLRSQIMTLWLGWQKLWQLEKDALADEIIMDDVKVNKIDSKIKEIEKELLEIKVSK